jgi:hypothetical protein
VRSGLPKVPVLTLLVVTDFVVQAARASGSSVGTETYPPSAQSRTTARTGLASAPWTASGRAMSSER